MVVSSLPSQCRLQDKRRRPPRLKITDNSEADHHEDNDDDDGEKKPQARINDLDTTGVGDKYNNGDDNNDDHGDKVDPVNQGTGDDDGAQKPAATSPLPTRRLSDVNMVPVSSTTRLVNKTTVLTTMTMIMVI